MGGIDIDCFDTINFLEDDIIQWLLSVKVEYTLSILSAMPERSEARNSCGIVLSKHN